MKRQRANRYGRRGGGNRCGHDPKRPVRVHWKANLPPIVKQLCQRMLERPLPLLLGRYARRSELLEAVRAVGPIMGARTDVRSWRIGKPDVADPRKWRGLSVDHDLARFSGISESRVERVIGTFTDWGWLHFQAIKPGRRKAKRGFLRCASQKVDKQPDGSHRGHAAIRVWTDEVWRHYGLTAAVAEARLALSCAQRKQADVVAVPLAPLVEQLVGMLWDPSSKPRPPPS